MAGLVGRVTFEKVLPGCSGAQNPEYGVQNIARISPGSAPTVFPSRWVWDKRLQHFSLLVCEVHTAVLLALEGHMTQPLYPHFRIYEMGSSHELWKCAMSWTRAYHRYYSACMHTPRNQCVLMVQYISITLHSRSRYAGTWWIGFSLQAKWAASLPFWNTATWLIR